MTVKPKRTCEGQISLPAGQISLQCDLLLKLAVVRSTNQHSKCLNISSMCYAGSFFKEWLTLCGVYFTVCVHMKQDTDTLRGRSIQ